jgi:hypothetical protein
VVATLTDEQLALLKLNGAALAQGLADLASLPLCAVPHRLARVSSALRSGLLGGGVARSRLRQVCQRNGFIFAAKIEFFSHLFV